MTKTISRQIHWTDLIKNLRHKKHNRPVMLEISLSKHQSITNLSIKELTYLGHSETETTTRGIRMTLYRNHESV